jgi:hypothetical protein
MKKPVGHLVTAWNIRAEELLRVGDVHGSATLEDCADALKERLALLLADVHWLRADLDTSHGHMLLDSIHSAITGDEVCEDGCPKPVERGRRTTLEKEST